MPPRPRFRLAAAWGVLGFCVLLMQAIARLAPLAIQALRVPLTSLQLVLYGASIGVMAYAEGYKGFQRMASPRIVVRALYLGDHPTLLRVVLAPFFCTGLFHATRRRMITSWLLYAGLVALIIAVRRLSQPWRGIVDAGVVVGLTWGVASILWFYGRALVGFPPQVSPELPQEAGSR